MTGRRALTVGGMVLLALGLLWMGQGSGLFRFPAGSFMVDQRPWIGRGFAVAVVGLVLVIASRGRRSR